MPGGGSVPKPPASRIAPASPLKLPQEAMVSFRKIRGQK